MVAFGDFLGSWVGFAFVAIAAAQFSLIFPKYFKLPLITGYMFFGVIAGPQAVGLLKQSDIPNLGYITQFALAFISLSAGAELYLPELKALFKSILTISFATTIITFTTCLFMTLALARGGLIPFIGELDNSACELAICLLSACIMVTQSPSSAIAVVKETRAKGPFTSTMLGITVFADVVVLVLYSISSSVAKANCDPNSDGFSIIELVLTIVFICTAGFLGWVMGKIIIFFIWLPRVPGEWIILPLGFFVFQFSHWFLEYTTEHWHHGVNFDALLICISAGYIVSNQSRNRRKFLRFLGRAGPLVFIPFFTLTGVGLQLMVMLQSLGFAVIMFLIRAVCFFIGAYGGGHYAKMPVMHKKYMWMAMLTQAGVSLGIVAEVALGFPTWGPKFASTMISVILINQILGPILHAWTIRKNNEDGKSLIDEEDDDHQKIKQCLIIGINPDSIALGQRLLDSNWDLVYLDENEEKFNLINTLHIAPRPKSHAGSAQTSPAHKPTESTIEPSQISLNNDSTSINNNSSITDDLTGGENLSSESPISPSGVGHEQQSHSVAIDNITAASAADKPRVQHRLIRPVILNSNNSNNNNSDKLYRPFSLGVESVTIDITGDNTQCAVLMLNNDSQAFVICNLLLEQLHLTKVITQVNNPNWASMFASIGVLSIFPFSSNVSLLYQSVVTGPQQQLELVKPTAPLFVSLAQLIQPDSKDEIPLNQCESSELEYKIWLQTHPDPPLPHDQLWKFNEKLKVVSQAGREEYVNQILGVHESRVDLQTMKKMRESNSTFSGPSMADDNEDEEEQGSLTAAASNTAVSDGNNTDEESRTR